MQGWKYICGRVNEQGLSAEDFRKLAREEFGRYGVYPDSIHKIGNTFFFMAWENDTKVLVIQGECSQYDIFDSMEVDLGYGRAKVCELNNYNCGVLRVAFPYMNPISHKGSGITLGLGDRLGMASPGHLRLIKDKNVFPVLAQQSTRELSLTKRSFDDVLSAASWAVFQEGYEKGFGADGDHLKTAEEVKMALDCGFTMITLDCSGYIRNDMASFPGSQIERCFSELPKCERERLKFKYLNKVYVLGDGNVIRFSVESLERAALVYLNAIKFTIAVYRKVIVNYKRQVDFEMSIDETNTPTSPESHFFVASELIEGGVEITSLAPRFCGEFQKGIDYRGDIGQFAEEFKMHVSIAEYFGYKISVHSGSDKFSVFPIIGKTTNGKYHLKTAGTNWLEALRVISCKDPNLFRRILEFAVSNVDDAKKYYHISAKSQNVPCIEALDDSELPMMMDIDDSRQILHITYGLILQARDKNGEFIFRNDIFSTLNKYENDYYESLEKHFARHLKELALE